MCHILFYKKEAVEIKLWLYTWYDKCHKQNF